MALKAHGHEALLQNAHYEYADNGTGKSTHTAAHTGTADNYACDAQNFLTVTGAGNDGGVNRCVEYAGQTAAEAVLLELLDHKKVNKYKEFYFYTNNF